MECFPARGHFDAAAPVRHVWVWQGPSLRPIYIFALVVYLAVYATGVALRSRRAGRPGKDAGAAGVILPACTSVDVVTPGSPR